MPRSVVLDVAGCRRWPACCRSERPYVARLVEYLLGRLGIELIVGPWLEAACCSNGSKQFFYSAYVSEIFTFSLYEKSGILTFRGNMCPFGSRIVGCQHISREVRFLFMRKVKISLFAETKK